MKIAILTIALLAVFLGTASAKPPLHKGKNDKYFQYINVPAHKEYEFGWNRGNPHHFVSRFEQAKGHRFRTKVKWGDTHGGYGEHYWEYNHAPKYGKHHGGYHDDKHHGGYHDDKHHGGYHDDKHHGGHKGHHGGHKGYHSEKVEVAIPHEIKNQHH